MGVASHFVYLPKFKESDGIALVFTLVHAAWIVTLQRCWSKIRCKSNCQFQFPPGQLLLSGVISLLKAIEQHFFTHVESWCRTGSCEAGWVLSKNEWGKKRIKFILFRKAGKTILSRNIARLGTRGELTSEILQGCAGHIIWRDFYRNLACGRTQNIEVVEQLKAIEYL